MFMLMLAITGSAYAQEDGDDSVAIVITIVNKTDAEDEWLLFTQLKSEVLPYIIDGTTMIPLRALAESFEYGVEYQEIDNKITIRDADKKNELILLIDSTTVQKNGQTDTLLQAPIVRDGRTFIPLRYVSEFFDKYVTWRRGIDEQTIFIWISAAQLLTMDDISVENDDNFYFSLLPEDQGIAVHVLKYGGHTFRGIKHGDSYENVWICMESRIEKYIEMENYSKPFMKQKGQ